MSEKGPIVVSLEREVNVGDVVLDLTLLLGCNTSTPKPPVPFENMVIANYWLSRGDQSPLYQISCRGVPKQGQQYPEKAYHFEVSQFQEKPITEELERKIKDTIRGAPSD